MGRSRGGLTTKIHALVDAKGLPFRFDLTPGQAHDSQAAARLLDDRQPDSFVLGDKAYDADWIRRQIEDQDAAANIPDRSKATLSARHSTASATGSNAFSTGSSTAAASPPGTRSSPPTISP